MATTKDLGFTYAAEAAADLVTVSKLNLMAKIDSNGRIAVCGAGEQPIGLITETAEQYKPATIQFGGIGKVVCGGSFNAGEIVGPDASGKAVRLAVSPGGGGLGYALEAGVDGRVISIIITHSATLV